DEPARVVPGWDEGHGLRPGAPESLDEALGIESPGHDGQRRRPGPSPGADQAPAARPGEDAGHGGRHREAAQGPTPGADRYGAGGPCSPPRPLNPLGSIPPLRCAGPGPSSVVQATLPGIKS